MKRILPFFPVTALCAILAVVMFTGCVSSKVSLSPSLAQSVQSARVDNQVAVYISTMYQNQVHTQNVPGPGMVDVELGHALMTCTRQALKPFFGVVMILGPAETTSLPYRIEVRTDRFRVQDDLGADVTIFCKVTKEGKTLLEESFEGHGAGASDPGFKKLDSARAEIKRSSEEAFQDAFTKLQKEFHKKVASS